MQTLRSRETPGTLYQIKVQGNLDPRWSDWFEGFVLSSRDNGETLLCGRVADQAALYGMLGKINSLGISLILVAQIDQLYTEKRCPLCGHSMGDDKS